MLVYPIAIIAFLAIVIVVTPFILVRNRMLRTRIENCMAVGDYAGAFDPIRKLLKHYFGDEGYTDNPMDSAAEKLIAQMSQVLANTPQLNQFAQIVDLHRRCIDMRHHKKDATRETIEFIKEKIQRSHQQGIRLLDELQNPHDAPGKRLPDQNVPSGAFSAQVDSFQPESRVD